MSSEEDLSAVSRYIARCPACNAYLDIREREVAYSCPRCDSSFHEVQDELRPVEVEFALPLSGEEPEDRRPFWEFQMDMPASLPSILQADLDQETLSIYVPAFDLPWEEALKLGLTLTSWQPDYALGPRSALRGCVLPQQRALEAAQLIYLWLLEKADVLPQLSDVSLPPLLLSRILVIPSMRKEADYQ